MINNKYGVLGMPVRSSSLTATQPPLAPPTAGSAVQGPEPGGFGMYPAMADGGIVDDQDADDSNYTVDLTAAIQAAQQALNYGRQQHGIPLEAFGDNPVMDTVSKLSQKTGPGLDANLQKPQPKPQDDESQEAQPDNEAAEGEAQPNAYAEGGEVEGGDSGGEGVIPNEAPQAQAPQDPTTAARSYVLGAGALPPEEATALEHAADPTGGMNPAERKLRAVAMAGDPAKQWAAIQHYRQKFNFRSAIAKAALQHGDLAGAARHATQAYENVPSGKHVSFMPTQGGLAVQIKNLTGGGNKPAQSFDDGGEVEGEVGGEAAPLGGGDPNMEDAQQGIDQDMVDYAVRQKEHKEEQDKVVQIPARRLEELLGDYDKAMNPDQLLSAPAQGAQAPAPPPQAPPSAPPTPRVPRPPRQGLETKVHLAGGNYDFDGGPETLPKKDTSGYGQIEERAQRIFPFAAQSKQREAYIAQMQMQEKKNEGGEHVQRVKSEGANQRADQVFQNKRTLQGEAEQAKAERLDKSLENKRTIAGQAEAGKNTRAIQGNKTRLQTNYESNHPSAKPADIKKYVESMGEEYVPGAPQGQGGQRPQGGQQQGQQPKFNLQSSDMGKLRSMAENGQITADVRARWEKTYGPGSLDIALSQLGLR